MLKILLWIFLSVLALIVIILLLRIKILIGYREKFYYKVYLAGFRVKQSIIDYLLAKRREIKRKKKTKNAPKNAGARTVASVPKEKASELSLLDDLSLEELKLLLRVALDLLKIAPDALRIKLRKLRIKVGSSDAADTAIAYGKVCAVTEGILAFFENYKGFYCGFFANRKKIDISADFLASQTEFDTEISISFFVWQLIAFAVRVGVEYAMDIVESQSN